MAIANLELKRYPLIKNDPLQAWDSADELILQHLEGLELAGKRILIINDSFGALSCSLQHHGITSYTDSYVSYQGIRINSRDKVLPIFDLTSLQGNYDFVILKFPKNMSFLEDILCHLTEHLTKGSKIICGVMVKHIASASFDLLNKYIGTTSTSLAQKKARLVFADFEKEKVTSPYPIKLKIDSLDVALINHSNLFSREKLDIGTRFFLEYLPQKITGSILDLGCANGIVGIMAKKTNPEAQLIFSDESYMAIKSAKENYRANLQDDAKFIWTNCYEKQDPDHLDLVLCNPPFHQQNTVGDFIAWQMFSDAYFSLKKGGRLRVIGNSHLGYHMKLKKLFGKSQIIATNNKFMIIDGIK